MQSKVIHWEIIVLVGGATNKKSKGRAGGGGEGEGGGEKKGRGEAEKTNNQDNRFLLSYSFTTLGRKICNFFSKIQK